MFQDHLTGVLNCFVPQLIIAQVEFQALETLEADDRIAEQT